MYIKWELHPLVYGGPVEKCLFNNGFWWSVSDFYISKTEVTQAQWVEIMGYNPSNHSNCDLCPIENISINEIEIFLNKLNARSNINYRLPTFWEWKFASRGGIQSDGSYNPNREAWYKSNSGDSTHQVMLKSSNEIGLFDTYGNVREYVDHFTPANWAGDEGVTADEGIGVYCPGTNPKRKRNSKSVYQNLMGGSYEEESSGFQEEHYQMTIGGKGADVGFRLAKSFRQ
jgi:formylglycine-generating enzyme required for sulfatase activity